MTVDSDVGAAAEDSDAGADSEGAADTDDSSGADDVSDTEEPEPIVYDPWPFAAKVVSFTFGEHAGYGQDRFPDVVYGPPESPGGGGGSLDVLSLGEAGQIVLGFQGIDLVDGPGIDLLVFENPFIGWYETGVVGVSEDGETWVEWPCDAEDTVSEYPGCAGVGIVYASATNGLDATDPDAAGGDAFDLADIGVSRARFVRIRDSGANAYAGTSGGFDLDAVALVHAAPQD